MRSFDSYLLIVLAGLWVSAWLPMAAAEPWRGFRLRRGLQETPSETPPPTPVPSSVPSSVPSEMPSLSSHPSDSPSDGPSDVPSNFPTWSFALEPELDDAFEEMADKFSPLESFDRLNSALPVVGKSINDLAGGSSPGSTLNSIIDFSNFSTDTSGVSRESLESDLNTYLNTTLNLGSTVEVDTSLPGCENATDPISVTFGTTAKETFSIKICSKISYSENLLLTFNGLFDTIGK